MRNRLRSVRPANDREPSGVSRLFADRRIGNRTSVFLGSLQEALNRSHLWVMAMSWNRLFDQRPPSLLVVPALCVVWARLPKSERAHVRLFAPSAVALFLLVGFGWYLWEASIHPGLLNYWVKDELVNRSLSDKFNRHPQFYMNFVIYLPILLFGLLPWSGMLACRIKAVWSTIRVILKSRWQMPIEPLWLLVTFAVPLGVFMLSRSKLQLYMLPLFVPLALGTGRMLEKVYGEWRYFQHTVVGLTVTALLLFAIGKGAVSTFSSSRDMTQLYTALTVREGVHDPTRLGVCGFKALNGLSYYYDHVLTMIESTDLSAWLNEDPTRVILCNFSKLERIRQILEGKSIEERLLYDKWWLVRLKAAVEPPAHYPNNQKGASHDRVIDKEHP